MMRFMTMVVGVLGFGFIVYQMLKFMFSISGTKGQRRRDVDSVRQDIKPLTDELVPLSSEELRLLSINTIKGKSKLGLGTQLSGHVLSIYQEPLLAYGRKNYGIGGRKSITLIKTQTEEYVYLSEGDRTQVVYNGHDIGVVNSDGNLYDHKTRELVAKIDVDEVLRTHPVIIEGREVGELVNIDRAESPSPRAYEFVEEMSGEELVKFKALTFLMLIEQIV